jgi:eukaryotic-like serine/threonine-protein kinase
MATSSSTELWRQADAILDQLLDLDVSARKVELERLTEPGPLREKVEYLLAALDRPGILDQCQFSSLDSSGVSSAPHLSGRDYGGYHLVSLIGRGGMSAVYKATRIDGVFDAPVALKLLNAGLLSTDWHDRFLGEVRFLAGLRHPHIANLLDAGVAEDGTPWLVTEFVDGEPIDRYCRRKALTLRERVALVGRLCAAVAFAQKNLIVHRDIKPENVLVTDEGRVVLLDFGIARALETNADSSVRRTMTRAFTPQYAAPEQIQGQPVTTATDVYGLGMLLYKVLTETVPFNTTESSVATRPTLRPSKRVARIETLEPTERKRRSRLLRGDLDNIVLKALEEVPDRRYANAEQMQADLDAWLDYRPVMARAPSSWVRVVLFFRRHTALALSLSALMLVGCVGLAATLWQAREARLQAELAQNVSDYLVSVFAASDPTAVEQDDPPASDLLRRGSREAMHRQFADPAIGADLLRIIGGIQRKLGFFDDARVSLSEARTRLPDRRNTRLIQAEILMQSGMLDHDIGQFDRSVEQFSAGLDLLARSLRPQDLRLLEARLDLAQLQVWTDPTQALEVLPQLRRMVDDEALSTDLRIKAARTLSMVLDSNRIGSEEAERVLLQALHLGRGRGSIQPLQLSEISAELGLLYLGRGQHGKAEEYIMQVIEIEQDVLGPEHPRLAQPLATLGFVRYYDNRPAESLQAFEAAHSIGSLAWPSDHPDLALYRASMAGSMWALGHGEQLDAMVSELAEAEVTAGYFAFLHFHHLLSLLDREDWQRAMHVGQEVQGLAEFESLSLNQQAVLKAAIARAGLRLGHHDLVSNLVQDIEIPDQSPERWAQQMLAALMVEVSRGLGDSEAVIRWQSHLDSAQSPSPVLERTYKTIRD